MRENADQNNSEHGHFLWSAAMDPDEDLTPLNGRTALRLWWIYSFSFMKYLQSIYEVYAWAEDITSNFLKAVFHKFYLVHSWIP